MLYYETYFEENNMNQKLIIWSQDKIITIICHKKWGSLVLGKVYENCLKINEKCYFMKVTSKRVI